MTTDIRAALEGLVAAVKYSHTSDMRGKRIPSIGLKAGLVAAMKAARLALAAEPEPPANCPGCEGVPAPGNQPCAVCGREASPPSPADGEVAELVAWMRSQCTLHAAAQTQWAKRFLRAADLLERQALQPVPVSELLPGPDDCDPEGRCWLFSKVENEWRLLNAANSGVPNLKYFFSHWIPAGTLPLPIMNENV